MDKIKGQQLLSTKSRMAYEKLEDERGKAIAQAVMLSSFERGNRAIHSCNREIMRKILLDVRDRSGMDPSPLDWEMLHEAVVNWQNDLGYHELVGNLMRTEIGTFSASIPRGYGKQKMDWSDFIDEHFKTFTVQGTDIVIIGTKGSGKTHLGVLLGETGIDRNLFFATNISVESEHEFVHTTDCLSDVFKLCASTDKHIILVIDEPEAVFSRLQSITKEAKNIDTFFNLTRKLHISVVTIWHFEKDIPHSLIQEMERNFAVKINKIHKKTAYVSGRDMNLFVKKIPDTSLKFKSVGALSAGSFDVDVDVRKVLGRLKHFKNQDESAAKKELLKILEDPLMYLPEYRSRFDSGQSKEEKLQEIKQEIWEGIDEYLTATGKTVDFTKIAQVHQVSYNDARFIKNEIMRSQEFKDLVDKRRNKEK